MFPALTAASSIAAAPQVDQDAPASVPAGYGLLAAANVLAGDERMGMFGVDWEPSPCSPALYWPGACTTGAPPAAKTFHDRPARITTDPFPIYWGEECGTIAFEDTDARVRAGLAQGESRAVEARIWGELGADSVDLGVGRGIVDALGHVEEELGDRLGVRGLIHAPIRCAAHAAESGLIRYDGPVMRTPLGHTWVFGGGYDPAGGAPPPDGAMLVGTGPTTLWRTPVFTQGPILDRSTNRYVAIAERIYMAGWDCAAVRITFPLSA